MEKSETRFLGTSRCFDFSEALRRLKLGAKLHRVGWRTKEMKYWVEVLGNKLMANYGVGMDFWEPTNEDILANDWFDPAE